MDGGLKLIPGRVVTFTVESLPKGKERPRTRVVPGKGNRKPFAQIYTPKSTKSYEAMVERVARQAMKNAPVIDGPVKVSILVLLPYAKTTPKYRIKAMRDGLEACTKKPDEDNVAKAVKDAMNGVIYKDDVQIVKSTVVKDFTDLPRVSVRVTELVVPEALPEEAPAPAKAEKKAAAPKVKSEPKPEEEPQLARALCGFDGFAKDCPNHNIPGAPWCDACRPAGKSK